jgi:hypothetical protein
MLVQPQALHTTLAAHQLIAASSAGCELLPCCCRKPFGYTHTHTHPGA